MKLIVTGATGFVASEVLRLAVQMSEITSIVAVARRPVKLTGPGADKVRSVVVEDYGTYSDAVRAEFAGANACIWTVAVLPHHAWSMDAGEVRRVCETAVAGLTAMNDSKPARPFRFLYMSGSLGAREVKEKPLLMGAYGLMRGDVEKNVLALAREMGDDGVEACVAKPGFISTGSRVMNAMGWVVKRTGMAPAATVTEISRGMLRQVVGGFERETLRGGDLERLGKE